MRNALKMLTASASVAALSTIMLTSAASAQSEVRFWYHFDNPDNPMSELVEAFEAEHPDITIQAENIPWNSYYDNLYTSIVGGDAPDAAMVKLFAQPRLIEMGALEPIGDRIDSWDGSDDLLPNMLDINAGPDGNQYYLPVQYVVLYLYYRTDLFEEAGLDAPATCDDFLNAAQTLTQDTDGDGNIDIYGFGFRGAGGGHDHWLPFIMSRDGVSLEEGGLTNDAAIAANQWVIDLHREHGVFPPSAPNDGFQETIAGFQQGRTAMTIHHIGSANAMVEALGDNVDAVPMPECDGNRWTTFGDESLAVFSTAEDKDAAWEWISFLASSGNNAMFNEATGQLPVTQSDSDEWSLHEPRFVQATVDSLPFANTLPPTPEASDFVNSVWPTNMQRALLGEISSEEMMQNIEELFHGE
ncbi:sugar ABC transporter substrate-binding protein [Fodinicurvata sp. EGI_FJ10296]|uniref:ABC transporter substrate-binding protein n=1 Tax=Fodinicurvata sp. EGI_FJ10296 TaxID=3231908 RepID=UPI0034525963